ncbi:unnamed protein product [Diatraea saccharalis]|uniref:TIMELESS-interacting protein n=1 Tax=Diatraea saccharalis TaxID=40085 RepID=A0A9N9RA03_9NEOP|nr:unnamed protein product [Diatraea saccharalis]
MSLLEDVFLENEADEAQELERVIEGEDYDERPVTPNSDENEEREDEAEEDKRRIDPTHSKTKRVIKNPRFLLNPARLTGPRGIEVIPEHFKDFKFQGKGHEKEDLDLVLKKLEHWAYRLYPKFEFADCLKKIETLGKKRPVKVHLHKIRFGLMTFGGETVDQKESSDDEQAVATQEDEFDKLLQQQIELAKSTPMSAKQPPSEMQLFENRSLLMPKATSSPSINDEQRERMLRNRRLAEERRLAKLKNNRVVNNGSKDIPLDIDTVAECSAEIEDDVIFRKRNISNAIDSSSDDDEISMNKSVTVQVHGVVKNSKNNDQTVKVNVNIVPDTSETVDTVADEIINEKTDEVQQNKDAVAESSYNVDIIDKNNKVDGFNVIVQSEIDNVDSIDDNNLSPVTDQTIHSRICIRQETEEEKVTQEIKDQPSEIRKGSLVSNEESVNKDINNDMDVDFDDDF